MKKAMACIVLALVLVVTGQRQIRETLISEVISVLPLRTEPQEDGRTDDVPSFSDQLGGSSASDMLDATVYFRYGQTSVLGAQRIQLDIRREETIAMSIVQRLVEGPSAAYGRLEGLFPQGTQVISVVSEGTTAFVTLSSAFLGKPDGAPADWEDLTVWQEEAALRRRLAVQSIVLSLTEEGRYQRVQMYVADSDDDVPRRIPMALLDTSVTDASLVLAPCTRDEQALLTPARLMRMALGAWQGQDWDALYALMAVPDGEQMPAFSVFEAQMRERNVSLLSYEVSEGTVSVDGKSATLVLDAKIRSADGGDAQIVRQSVLLTRVADNWSLAPDTLTALMIRD